MKLIHSNSTRTHSILKGTILSGVFIACAWMMASALNAQSGPQCWDEDPVAAQNGGTSAGQCPTYYFPLVGTAGGCVSGTKGAYCADIYAPAFTARKPGTQWAHMEAFSPAGADMNETFAGTCDQPLILPLNCFCDLPSSPTTRNPSTDMIGDEPCCGTTTP